jgi:hypothetical protein
MRREPWPTLIALAVGAILMISAGIRQGFPVYIVIVGILIIWVFSLAAFWVIDQLSGKDRD